MMSNMEAIRDSRRPGAWLRRCVGTIWMAALVLVAGTIESRAAGIQVQHEQGEYLGGDIVGGGYDAMATLSLGLYDPPFWLSSRADLYASIFRQKLNLADAYAIAMAGGETSGGHFRARFMGKILFDFGGGSEPPKSKTDVDHDLLVQGFQLAMEDELSRCPDAWQTYLDDIEWADGKEVLAHAAPSAILSGAFDEEGLIVAGRGILYRNTNDLDAAVNPSDTDGTRVRNLLQSMINAGYIVGEKTKEVDPVRVIKALREELDDIGVRLQLEKPEAPKGLYFSGPTNSTLFYREFKMGATIPIGPVNLSLSAGASAEFGAKWSVAVAHAEKFEDIPATNGSTTISYYIPFDKVSAGVTAYGQAGAIASAGLEVWLFSVNLDCNYTIVRVDLEGSASACLFTEPGAIFKVNLVQHDPFGSIVARVGYPCIGTKVIWPGIHIPWIVTCYHREILAQWAGAKHIVNLAYASTYPEPVLLSNKGIAGGEGFIVFEGDTLVGAADARAAAHGDVGSGNLPTLDARRQHISAALRSSSRMLSDHASRIHIWQPDPNGGRDIILTADRRRGDTWAGAQFYSSTGVWQFVDGHISWSDRVFAGRFTSPDRDDLLVVPDGRIGSRESARLLKRTSNEGSLCLAEVPGVFSNAAPRYDDRVLVGDLNGDGHDDLLVVGDRVSRSTRTGTLVLLWDTNAVGFATNYVGDIGLTDRVLIADLTGDGTNEIVTTACPLTSDAPWDGHRVFRWNGSSLTNVYANPNRPSYKDQLSVGHFLNDKRDALLATDHVTLGQAEAGGGYQIFAWDTNTVDLTAKESGGTLPASGWRSPRLLTGDYDGDGLTDVLLIDRDVAGNQRIQYAARRENRFDMMQVTGEEADNWEWLAAADFTRSGSDQVLLLADNPLRWSIHNLLRRSTGEPEQPTRSLSTPPTVGDRVIDMFAQSSIEDGNIAQPSEPQPGVQQTPAAEGAGLMAMSSESPGITSASVPASQQVTNVSMSSLSIDQHARWFISSQGLDMRKYDIPSAPKGIMVRVSLPDTPLFNVDVSDSAVYAAFTYIGTCSKALQSLADNLKDRKQYYEYIDKSLYQMYILNDRIDNRPITTTQTKWTQSRGRTHNRDLALWFALVSFEVYNDPGMPLNLALLREGFTGSQLVFNTDGTLSCIVASRICSTTGKRLVVIAFKGSDPTDWNETNLKAWAAPMISSPDKSYRIHGGFSQQVQDLVTSESSIPVAGGITLREVIDSRDPNTLFYVTGHSLGGGLAQIYGARLVDAKVRPTLYTYAAPPAGDKEFGEAYAGSMDIFSFADVRDPVPKAGGWYAIPGMREAIIPALRRFFGSRSDEEFKRVYGNIKNLRFIEEPLFAHYWDGRVYGKAARNPLIETHLLRIVDYHQMPNYTLHAINDYRLSVRNGPASDDEVSRMLMGVLLGAVSP